MARARGTADGQLPFERLSNVRLVIGDLPLGDPRRASNAIREKLQALFSENFATGDVEFSGDVVLDIQGVTQVANLYTERVGETFKLRFRGEDIRAISQAKGMGLVPEQIEIVSLYPLRAPVILLLTDQARALAAQHAPDDVWLRDATQHVIWSYMDFHNNAIGRRFVSEIFGKDRLLR